MQKEQTGARKATHEAHSTNGSHAMKKKAGTAAHDSRLEKFFLDELKDIYWAEQKLVKTLPKMQKAASSKELQTAFANHLKETEGHVERLEKAFGLLGEKAVSKKCEAMEGITEEGSSIIGDTKDGTATRDVGLVLAGQKAEHYEIATYGGLIQLAQTLGHDDVAKLFEATLQEEKNADQKLTSIAENHINYEAATEA
jgi:ferritin-like metal-binding protein YciE